MLISWASQQPGQRGVLPFTPLPLSTAKSQGDSRSAALGDYINNGVSVTVTVGLYSVGSLALVQAMAGNIFLFDQGFQHAVGASTTLAQFERDKTNAITTTGNTAFAQTNVAADANFSFRSDGNTTPLTQPGKHIISASMGVNDGTGTSGAFYDNPITGKGSLSTINSIAVSYSAKVLYTGNEFPRGDSYYTMELKTVTGGTCTASNIVNFVDGESFGAPGAIGIFATGLQKRLTKVTANPQQDEYMVNNATGVYTFGGATKPLTARIHYNSSPPAGRYNYAANSNRLLILNEFYNSSAPNFVSAVNGQNYNLPGLKYGKPHVRVCDTWNALLDASSGAARTCKPGTSDSLQLHNLGYGAYLAGKVISAKIRADYPTAPDLSTSPRRNNWRVAVGNGALTAYSGTLPPTMRTAFTGGTPAPTLISRNGVPIGSINVANGAITGTGILNGNLNFDTGVWNINFNAATEMPVSAQLWFEQDIGNFDIANLLPGNISRNPVMNGLLDIFTAVGTGISSGNGVSSIPTIANTSIPYGYTLTNTALVNAINAGTATASIDNITTDDGFPMLCFNYDGIHNADIIPTLSTGVIPNYTSRVSADQKAMVGSHVRHRLHPTLGSHYGNNGYANTLNLSLSNTVPRNSPTGIQNVGTLATRVNDRGLNLFPVDTLILKDEPANTWDLCRISALLDTTGGIVNTAILNFTLGSAQANFPASFSVGVQRLFIRVRSDV